MSKPCKPYTAKGTFELMMFGLLLGIPKNLPIAKLAKQLLYNQIPFEFVHQEFGDVDYIAICSPSYGDECKIDAIFHPGTYGYEDDLIEIWDFSKHDPEGCLTPEKACERFKEVIKG